MAGRLFTVAVAACLFIFLLITRNVDFGDTLTPTSQVRFIRSGPLTLRHVVWITRGGGAFVSLPKWFKAELLFRDDWRESDPDAPLPVYRVMRP